MNLNDEIARQIDGWIRGYDYMAPECPHLDHGWCYVVYSGDSLKIGSCRVATRAALEDRLKSIQGMTPAALEVMRLYPGGRRREKELHRKFAAMRQHGEWFSWEILGDLPMAGCEDCGFIVMPLDEDPEAFLRQLRADIDEAKR